MISVNPDVLKWAREEDGYLASSIAQKLKVEEATYLQWEQTGNNIPFSVMKKIASTLKRQIAVFFLPHVPSKTKKPKDFRNLKLVSAQLSPSTHLAIRRAKKFQEVLLGLNGAEYYQKKYSWLAEYYGYFGDGALTRDEVTYWIRQKLQYSIDDQMRDKNIEKFYKNLRDAFEVELGINVFQLKMPAAEIQGFCYSDNVPYCIVVNSEYSTSSKIFTLFHELGHILKKQSGICLPDKVTEDEPFELEFNSFAGKTILPQTVVVPLHTKDEIYTYARKCKVSSEVYLRRQKSLGLVTTDEFFSLLDEIRSSVKPSRKGGRGTPVQKSINSRGRTLFNSIIDAMHGNRMSYHQASDILGVKVNHLLTM